MKHFIKNVSLYNCLAEIITCIEFYVEKKSHLYFIYYTQLKYTTVYNLNVIKVFIRRLRRRYDV